MLYLSRFLSATAGRIVGLVYSYTSSHMRLHPTFNISVLTRVYVYTYQFNEPVPVYLPIYVLVKELVPVYVPVCVPVSITVQIRGTI
jgi:hypothetical protein